MIWSSLSSTKHFRAFWTSANTTRASSGERAEDSVAIPSWVGTYLCSPACSWNTRNQRAKSKESQREKAASHQVSKLRSCSRLWLCFTTVISKKKKKNESRGKTKPNCVFILFFFLLTLFLFNKIFTYILFNVTRTFYTKRVLLRSQCLMLN